MERKLLGKKFSKILGKSREVVLFLVIFRNAVPFRSGSCRKFKPEILVEWKASAVFFDNERFWT